MLHMLLSVTSMTSGAAWNASNSAWNSVHRLLTRMPAESPVLGNGHAGFGGQGEETDRSKGWHRASF